MDKAKKSAGKGRGRDNGCGARFAVGQVEVEAGRLIVFN